MNEEGFTLLEILIATTITGVILLAVFMFINQGLFTWENTSDSNQWEQNFRILNKYIDDDLHNLFYSNLFKENLFQGENQSVNWLIRKGNTLKEVNYRVDYYSNVLVREEKPYHSSIYPFDENPDENLDNSNLGSNDKIVSFFKDTDIFRIDFQYYDPQTGGWPSFWSLDQKDYLPTFLRIIVSRSNWDEKTIISDIYIGKEYERGAYIYE